MIRPTLPAVQTTMIQLPLTLIATGLYLAAGATLGLRLARRLPPERSRLLGLLGAALAVAFHAVLVYRGLATPYGLDLGFFNALSLITWLMATLLLVAATRQPVENLGVIILPVAATAVLLNSLFAGAAMRQEPLGDALDAHILLSVIAYSVLGIAAVQALLLAVQDHHLRHRQPGGFIRMLPPLQTMEALLFQMLWVGFISLSLALASGLLFLDDIFAQHLVHKTVLSIAAWVVFGVLLLGRWRSGWRGPTAIRWTLGGFLALMLAYFGSKFVLELLLGR